MNVSSNLIDNHDNNTLVVFGQYFSSLIDDYGSSNFNGMNYGERLKFARKLRKMTQDTLAEKSGVKQGTISKIERGDQLGSTFDARLAEVLRISALWLSSGEGPLPSAEIETITVSDNVASYEITGLVPLISWVQAGEWHEAQDLYQPGDADEVIPCIATHGIHTYALRVEGDSMTSPTGKSYPHGCIVFIDPDQIGGVNSGDRVIAKINGDALVTFKQFVQDGGRKFLRPLNPQYPIITDEFRIIGKVIGKWEAE